MRVVSSNVKQAGLFVLVLLCMVPFITCMQRRAPIYYVRVLRVLYDSACMFSQYCPSGTAVILDKKYSVITIMI